MTLKMLSLASNMFMMRHMIQDISDDHRKEKNLGDSGRLLLDA